MTARRPGLSAPARLWCTNTLRPPVIPTGSSESPTAVATAGTTVTISDTAPTKDRYNLGIVEVLATAGVAPTWTLSGSITPATVAAGTTVTLGETSSATTTADANGNYSFTGLANGSYIVTPTKSGASFSPSNQPATTVRRTRARSPMPMEIIRSPGGSGATVGLSGAATGTSSADANGNFGFAELTNGTYPDGRVPESGMGADFGNVPDEKSAEFYSPPYLFKGARPTITQAPAQVQYNATFFVGTPDAASIANVSLIRTGAVTHFFDENERYLPLTFTQTTGGLNVTAPVDANLAPPGFYMLFIINSNGVPSVAPFVQVQ
jgi:Galactose oxidase-like, Early set domain/SdrD B-like domain